MKSQFLAKPFHCWLLPFLFIANRFFSFAIPYDLEGADNYLAWCINTGVVLVVVLLFTCSLYFFIKWRVSDRNFAANLTTIIMLPVLFFQDILLFLSDLLHTEIRARWLMLLSVLLVLISIYVLSKKRNQVISEYLNVTLAAITLYTVCVLCWSFTAINPARVNYQQESFAVANSENRDVYFIILDSYSSNKSLRQYLEFDNNEFTAKLKKLGFQVSDHSITKFDKTIYSLASILNLNNIVIDRKYSTADALRLIRNNSVTHSFSKAGYEIINYSLFDLAQAPRYYSSYYNQLSNEFFDKIFQNTICKWIAQYFTNQNADAYFSENIFSLHKDIISKVQSHAASPNAHKPRFFYIHLMAPHPPYVIDANGNEIALDKQADGNSKEAYNQQLAGLNKLILPMLNTIIKKSARSPIIILQGDHGARITTSKDESHSVFQALYLPDALVNQAADSNSYNVFRMVVRHKGQ